MKRQQATEDAIAIGLRAVATGAPHRGYLPPGPIFGIPVTEPLVTEDDSTGHGSNHTEKENEAENTGEPLFDIHVRGRILTSERTQSAKQKRLT